MKRIVYFFITMLLVGHGLVAQEIEWERRFEFLTPTSVAQGVAITNQNEIAILAAQNGSPDADGVLLFVDQDGDTVWTRDLTSDFWANYRSPINIQEEELVFSGTRYNEIQDTVLAEIQKWDLFGNQIYKRTFNTGKIETTPRDLYLGQNNYLFCGSQNVGQVGLEHLLRFHLVKFDSLGGLIWHKSFRDSLPSLERSVSVVPYEGGVSLYGDISEPGLSQPIILKANGNGDSIASKKLVGDGDYNAQGGNMFLSSDNHFIFCGRDDLDATIETFIRKIDTSFNFIWETIIPMQTAYSQRAMELNDGNILVATHNNGQDTIHLHYLDSETGMELEHKWVVSSYGHFGDVRDVELTGDSCLYYAGVSADNSSRGHAYIAKISGVGAPAVITGEHEFNWGSSISKSAINFYPNPSQDYLNINPQQSGMLHVYDVSGVLIREEQINSDTQWLVSDWASGVYTYRFITKGFTQGGSLVKE